MAITIHGDSYGTRKNILSRPDHYVNVDLTLTSTEYAAYKDANGVIPGGTIYPANDNTAIGLFFQDYDVKDGDDVLVAITQHGWIKLAALPAPPATAAKEVLPMIIFE
jgi:hypothetical protein